MKQNVIIDTKDGKVRLQFDKCTSCKTFDFCYKNYLGNHHKGVPHGLSEECFEEEMH